MTGAELAALYAFPPNSLGYCGTGSFRDVLSSHLDSGGRAKDLEGCLRDFRVHHAYLSLIARESGLRPFDEEVVKAFWLGNGLLEAVSRASLRRFITEDLFANESAARARRLCDDLPEGILPHHSFNVLYVNFVTDKVARSVRSYDSCCVTWGEALDAKGQEARIRRRAITRGRYGFALEERNGTVRLERDGVRLIRDGPVKAGDALSVHWGLAVQRLSSRDAEALEKYTARNIDAINSMVR